MGGSSGSFGRRDFVRGPLKNNIREGGIFQYMTLYPQRYQRGLNASNAIPSPASELEVGCGCAEFAELSTKQGLEPDWALCAEAATAGNPACTKYAGVIANFARLYGGGGGAPLLRKLNAFAKKYTEGRVLGEEFLTHMASFFDTLAGTFQHDPAYLARRRSMLSKGNSGFYTVGKLN